MVLGKGGSSSLCLLLFHITQLQLVWRLTKKAPIPISGPTWGLLLRSVTLSFACCFGKSGHSSRGAVNWQSYSTSHLPTFANNLFPVWNLKGLIGPLSDGGNWCGAPLGRLPFPSHPQRLGISLRRVFQGLRLLEWSKGHVGHRS